jgi:hypothetical protein
MPRVGPAESAEQLLQPGSASSGGGRQAAAVLLPRSSSGQRDIGGRWFASQLAVYGFAQDRVDTQLANYGVAGAQPRSGLTRCAAATKWSTLALALHAVTVLVVVPWLTMAEEYTSNSQSGASPGVQGDENSVFDGVLVFLSRLGILGAFFLLGLADRLFVLRMALRQSPRLGLILAALDTDCKERVTLRIGAASRRLCWALWLPTIPISLYMKLVGGNWDDGSLDGSAHGVLTFVAVVVVFLLPAVSLSAAVVMLWAESIVVEEKADSIVEDVKVQPETERDVAQVLVSFGEVRNLLLQAGREWTPILLVQIALFCCVIVWAISVLIEMSADPYFNKEAVWSEQVYIASTAAPLLWPLVLSFLAIVRVNSVLAAVPRRITTEFLFSPAERCFFAGDYERLGLHMHVLGVRLTSHRLISAMLSGLFALALTVIRAFLNG